MKLFEITQSSVYWDTTSEKEQTSRVRRNPSSIREVINPSEFLQLIAVQNDGWIIQYIKHPTPQVQLVAVSRWPPALEYIDNPTQEALLTALKAPVFIRMTTKYERVVKKLFANNTILMKKWLRYGQAMREEYN
ncbi:hypothetical protein M0R04_07655 [Candidatus Dojkabacteria bacterium]|jgi:hypothetical protein|nr:hypothetical protein [Candidatus Dojkabacteria bacterium]